MLTRRLLFPALALLLSAVDGSAAIIRREGWSYDRADFFAAPSAVDAARRQGGDIRLGGWTEFDFTIPEAGWYELFVGGLPVEWPRDLFLDGTLVYRLSGGTSDDVLDPRGAPGEVQFKDANLYLTSGPHTLQFQRQRDPGALPRVWELRPAPAARPESHVRVQVEGHRIVEPGAAILLRVTGGGERQDARYELSLRDVSTGAETPVGDVAFAASASPVTKEIAVSLDAPGLYTVIARTGGRVLRDSEFRVGRFLAANGAAKSRLEPLSPPDAARSPLLAAPFRTDAVLQRDKPLPVWGWALPGETVTVRLAGKERRAVPGPDGRWQVVFDPMPAGGPHELSATASSGGSALAKNVLIGEVWLLSGQSNMGGSLNSSTGGIEAARAANHPDVRITFLYNSTAVGQLGNVWWQPAVSGGDPKAMEKWVGIHYAFGVMLKEKLGVPVGLIAANRGGTAISTWTSLEAHRADPTFRPLLENHSAGRTENLQELVHLAKLSDQVEKWRRAGAKDKPPALAAPTFNLNSPAYCYDELIAPLSPFAIRGVLWYQGESDAGAAEAYRLRFPAMIRDWRALWKEPGLPFVYAQISYSGGKPATGAPGENSQAELREAQLLALSVPRTAMIVTTDLMKPTDDVHYKDKLTVGRRFALAALAAVYGDSTVEASGPVYREMKIEHGAIRLRFDHAAGLRTNDGARPGGFAIAGDDRKWEWAEARIEGEEVVVGSPKVPAPMAVRYGWSGYPCGANLANGADLPASSFRTDDWPLFTTGKLGFQLQ